MSDLLWVEDFESRQYREFSYSLFGEPLCLESAAFPDEEPQLRKFLKGYGIHLATSFEEADAFIHSRRDVVDGVVLDIDLNICDELPGMRLCSLLETWYEYNPRAPDDEASYNAALRQMKPEAGYHLFLDLVMHQGFPSDRVLFCSNHGENLHSKEQLFKDAKILPPRIFRKSDPDPARWIRELRSKRYTRVRRAIINSCHELTEDLRFGKRKYVLPRNVFGKKGHLGDASAEVMLQTIPRLMPIYEDHQREQQVAYRLVVRVLTQEWDFNPYSSELKGLARHYAAVLFNTRNFTSHDSESLCELFPEDVAYLLLVAIWAAFDYNEDKVEKIELGLLNAIGPRAMLDEVGFDLKCETVKSEMRHRCSDIPLVGEQGERRHFGQMIKALQQEKQLSQAEQRRMLYHLLWQSAIEESARNERFRASLSKPSYRELVSRTLNSAGDVDC